MTCEETKVFYDWCAKRLYNNRRAWPITELARVLMSSSALVDNGAVGTNWFVLQHSLRNSCDESIQ